MFAQFWWNFIWISRFDEKLFFTHCFPLRQNQNIDLISCAALRFTPLLKSPFRWNSIYHYRNSQKLITSWIPKIWRKNRAENNIFRRIPTPDLRPPMRHLYRSITLRLTQAHLFVVMKNWQPFVLGPLLAMDSMPDMRRVSFHSSMQWSNGFL